jgi:hypothetical protein
MFFRDLVPTTQASFTTDAFPVEGPTLKLTSTWGKYKAKKIVQQACL